MARAARRWLGPAVVLGALALAGGGRRRRDDELPDAPGDNWPPIWPLATASRAVSRDFAEPRPHGSTSPSRHHVGEDLHAARGTIIRAPQSGRVVVLRPTFYRADGTDTGIMMVDTGSNVYALGEIEPHSWVPFGVVRGRQVVRGQDVATVGATAQLHFELYRAGTRDNISWPWGTPKPAAIVDPTDYLLAAGGRLA